MTVGWESEKVWEALKKIQLWSLIPLQKKITHHSNDIFLPVHAVFKWGEGETEWVFQMCGNDDRYLSLTGLSDGQSTLCLNAFLQIPSCMRCTLWGIFAPIKWEQEGDKKIFFFLFLIQMEFKQRDIQRDFFFHNYWALHQLQQMRQGLPIPYRSLKIHLIFQKAEIMLEGSVIHPFKIQNIRISCNSNKAELV